MLKRYHIPISLLIIIAAVFWSFYGNMPQQVFPEDKSNTRFSTARAFEHVEEMAQQPHFVGSPAHNKVKNYIVAELQKMDLLVQTQSGYFLNKYGTITQPQNILARIEGSRSGKSLLLLSHYDSAVHSSFGASDAASGVATILEGIRAFLASGKNHTNDIIILFSDAEEVGLNGAGLFMANHPWAKDVGLALNFEARGSGGPSFMLLETNAGNKKLINHFINADPEFPVTNSLAYSVYKMLPNDTDLTVLRKKGNINGFNFAFIDDHFDYHTALDIPENLDKNTLAHQGSYFMPLLDYFSDVPLENLNSAEDLIYFNIPVLDMVYYPFSWIFPMLILAILLFIVLTIYGILKKEFNIPNIFKGFFLLVISIFGAGILVFFLWKLCLFIYPEYGEMEHGFTYNGYYYIAAFIFLSLAICFFTYSKFQKQKNSNEFFVAPLFLWILISAAAAFYLKGAAYFIIPVFFGLLQLFLLIKQKKPNLLLLSLLSLPAIFIVLPFVATFPVALGLGILFASAVLMVFLWVLFWPIFLFYKQKRKLGFFCLLVFAVLFFVAHLKSDFNVDRPKPNSLVYIFDADKNTASWNTYDGILDSWTAPFFDENAEMKAEKIHFSSKYDSGFTRSSEAPVVEFLPPTVVIQKEDTSSEITNYSIKIAPNREINQIDVYADKNIDFKTFTVNGQQAESITSEENSLHIFKNRWHNKLLTYYAVNQDTLRLNFSLPKGVLPELVLYESSYDLLENEQLLVPARTNAMIPRPFVLNDAVIIKKTINLE